MNYHSRTQIAKNDVVKFSHSIQWGRIVHDENEVTRKVSPSYLQGLSLIGE